jgi:hypothetical protein
LKQKLNLILVTPAQAGAPLHFKNSGIPACAGMTGWCWMMRF